MSSPKTLIRLKTLACSSLLLVACSGDDRGGADAAGTGVPSAEDGTGDSAGDGDGDGGEDSNGDEDALFDVADGDEGGADDGGGGCGDDGELEFSYIWVANSTQGTVTKMDTRTMVEEGRYLVRDDGVGDPSRTSVNLSGDVAVANRSGGLTKVFARVADCQDTNGTPGIQTSGGKDDILPWGEEECIAWHSDTGYAAQRPVAWTAGDFDEPTCTYFDAKVWTAGNKDPWGAQEVWFSRVNGDDGSLDMEVHVPELHYYALGPYGGAADGDGNFWFTGMMTDESAYNGLIRVDGETTDYTIYPFPEGISPYGITVDHNGRPWTAGSGVARFDPDTETFDYTTDYGGAGLMEDAKGRMWFAHSTDPSIGSVVALDVDTMEFVKGLTASHQPGGTPMFAGKGISVDFDGYIWQISKTLSHSAHRFDPDTGDYEYYEGLTQPYTYSDMTGWGLKNAVGPPPQG